MWGRVRGKLTKGLVYLPLFWLGYGYFKLTGRTPHLSYVSFRRLYCLTRGRFTSRLADRISRHTPKIRFTSLEGVLGSGEALAAEIGEALQELHREGYHVFRTRLRHDTCEQLLRFAQTNAATLVPTNRALPSQARFDPEDPKAPRYQFDERDLIGNPAVQDIVADPTLIYLAQEYLNAPPINDLVTLWWSAPYGSKASSEAAQLFHFDMDRIRFLKVFIYLTEVGPRNGPHVYVKGTQKNKPERFFRDRRFSDEEIEAHFSSEEIRSVLGPPGTIIAADTSALHKGQVVETGSRLIFQLEFTNSLFGVGYERHRLPSSLGGRFKRSLGEYPAVFARFRLL